MKSHVSMEQKICPCCDKTFDSGAILLDRKLKNSMERNTITGFQLCSDCRKEGFVLMVEINNPPDGKTITPQDAYRTGKTAYIKKDVFSKMFNVENPVPFCYAGKEVFDILESLDKQPDEA